MVDPSDEELSEFWLAAPTDIRMWAIDQARGCISGYHPFPLCVADVMEMASLFVFEVMRQPKVAPPSVEDTGEDGVDVTQFMVLPGQHGRAAKTWRTDRGLA